MTSFSQRISMIYYYYYYLCLLYWNRRARGRKFPPDTFAMCGTKLCPVKAFVPVKGFFLSFFLTHILHILIARQREQILSLGRPAPGPGHVGLVDDDAVRHGGGDEGGTIRVAGPSAVVIEGDVGQAVAQHAQEEREMAGEPAEPIFIRRQYRISF